ncbi:MAG: hypothetical protein QOC81_1708 [Thermoanaerobaculia bacterium]|jgi:hypothetical protein|nr:hypothetical protein [Thermoanaerobaculia bacterium]
MKRLAFALLVLSLTSATFAADEPEKTKAPAEKPAPSLGARADKLIKEAIPVCAEKATESRVALTHKLPDNMIGAVIRVESERSACSGQWVAAISNEGGFYMGTPWFLDDTEGTPEERLKAFTLQYMKAVFEPVVDRTKTREGLFPVRVSQPVDGGGKLPLEGEIHPSGSVMFIGHFVPMSADFRTSRVKGFEPFLGMSPTTGAAKPEVTVIEFSDFECPSCKHASGYLKPILAAHPDKVRYIRYDTPLVTIHTWALSAAVAGRAIWHQKPELFWKYKEQVYENQDKLSAFTIDEFTRGFASDHDLDMKKYDAEVASTELRNEILNGAGNGFSNDVRATPTYIVNGAFVDPGAEGKELSDYVNKLLKK